MRTEKGTFSFDNNILTLNWKRWPKKYLDLKMSNLKMKYLN